MRRGWTEVALGEVAEHRNEFFEIDDLSTYKRCRVKLHAKGIQQRDAVPGAMIKTKTQQRCRANDFMVAEIDAKVGGFGIVPKSLDGAIVSSHYFLFEANPVRLDFRFLGFFCRTRRFFEQVAAQGSTNYAAIRPRHVLDYKIPLPPLAEQERLVARLDAIEHRLHRVQKLRDESEKETRALIRSCLHEEHCRGIRHVPMSELVQLRAPDTTVIDSENYTFAGVYSFGRGVFKKEPKSGMDFAYDRLTRIRMNEFTYPKLMAWEGALGVVPPDCDGCYVSPEFPVFTIDTKKVLPEIVDIHFKSPSVWRELGRLSTGTNLRRRRLNPNAFLNYVFPTPPMNIQKRIAAISRQTQQKVALAEKALIRQKAVLPSLLDQIFG